MSSIINMVPSTEQILIDGKPYTLRGLSLKSISKVFARFPDAMRWIEQESIPDIAAAVVAIPEAAADVMAGGIKGADETTRAIVDDLEFITQLDLIERIIVLTTRGSLRPLLDRVKKLKSALAVSDADDASAGGGPLPSDVTSSLNSGSSPNA